MKILDKILQRLDELSVGHWPEPLPEDDLDPEYRQLVSRINGLIDHLRSEPKTFGTLLDQESIPVLVTRLEDGHLLYANDRAREVFPLLDDASRFHLAQDFWANPNLRGSFVDKVRNEGKVNDYEVEYRKADGTSFQALVSAKRLVFAGEEAILASFVSISERLQVESVLRETLDLNQKLLEASPVGISVYRADTGQCVLANSAMGTIIGATREQVLSQQFRELSSWKESGLLGVAERCLTEQALSHVTLGLRTSFGKHIWILATFTPFVANQKPHLLLLVKDVTDRVLAEQKLQEANASLERLAREDALTGLANRRHFNERLEAEIRRTRRAGKGLSLIMGDIDYFKLYNDGYGHPMGDACLISVAEIMKGFFKRGGDLVARIGGEEFAILLPETPLRAASQLAEDLRLGIESAGIPHKESKVASVVTMSLGVAGISPDEERHSTWLMGAVDDALYVAKESGRNRIYITDRTSS